MRNLKIVHIDSENTWRGGQKQVIELVRGLENLGQKNCIVFRPQSEIAKKARENGFKYLELPLKSEIDFGSAIKLRSFIKKNRIDIVHAHSSHAHTIALMSLLGINSCKLVVSRRVDFHLSGYLSVKYKYNGRVDKIITVSDAIKRILIEDGVIPEKIVTIRSGFIPGAFENEMSYNRDLRKEYEIDDNTLVVSTVAALAPHKAHNVLLKAANIVLKKNKNVKFLIAGEGEMRTSIEKDIYNFGLKDSVILLGFVKNIGPVYKASDIFAISSEEEGLCTSLFDAMYHKLPIVATSAGGIPEIVQDCINGYIVPVNDFITFADRLNTLIENKEKRLKMGERTTTILEQNKIEKTVEKTLAVYRELWN